MYPRAGRVDTPLPGIRWPAAPSRRAAFLELRATPRDPRKRPRLASVPRKARPNLSSFKTKKATPSGVPDASGFFLAAGCWRLCALSFGALAPRSFGVFLLLFRRRIGARQRAGNGAADLVLDDHRLEHRLGHLLLFRRHRRQRLELQPEILVRPALAFAEHRWQF